MNDVLIVTLLSSFGSLLIANLPIWTYLKIVYKKPTLKPFDCSYCLSGWSAIALAIIFGFNWYQVITFMVVIPFITAVLQYITDKMRSL